MIAPYPLYDCKKSGGDDGLMDQPDFLRHGGGLNAVAHS